MVNFLTNLCIWIIYPRVYFKHADGSPDYVSAVEWSTDRPDIVSFEKDADGRTRIRTSRVVGVATIFAKPIDGVSNIIVSGAITIADKPVASGSIDFTDCSAAVKETATQTYGSYATE